MKVQVWLTLVPGADRVYAQTYPLSPSRYESIKKEGGEVHLAEIEIPGWKIEDRILHVTAKPVL